MQELRYNVIYSVTEPSSLISQLCFDCHVPKKVKFIIVDLFFDPVISP